jgi:predicted lipoprotein
MKFYYNLLLGLAVGVGLMAAGTLSACTTVTFAEATAIAQGGAFDAKSFVETKWTEVVSTIQEKGVELPQILAAIKSRNGQATKADLQGVAQQYGLTTEGEAHVFMTKGQGTVTAINTQSSIGTMELALDGYDGPIKVKVMIGPRIPSDETSVRDAVGFIKFGDFKEQTEFGKVSRELNKRVIETVFEGLDRENLLGKTVTFNGVFTIRTFNEPGDINVSEIGVTPIQLAIGG